MRKGRATTAAPTTGPGPVLVESPAVKPSMPPVSCHARCPPRSGTCGDTNCAGTWASPPAGPSSSSAAKPMSRPRVGLKVPPSSRARATTWPLSARDAGIFPPAQAGSGAPAGRGITRGPDSRCLAAQEGSLLSEGQGRDHRHRPPSTSAGRRRPAI